MKPLFFLFSGLICAGLFFGTTSCKKETDCKAVVLCIDSSSAPVPGAEVLLYAQVKSPDGKTTYTADLQATGNTDAAGQVSFTFELPAIYDVRATKMSDTTTLLGVGIIKLEEGETVSKTLILKPAP